MSRNELFSHFRQALIASVPLVLLLAVFLAIRRASGAMTAPLPVGSLVVTALVLFGWAGSVRQVAPRLGDWVPTLVLLLFAFACSAPASRVVDWVVWLPVIIGDGWLARRAGTTVRRDTTATDDISTADSLRTGYETLQELTRLRTADGREIVRGRLVAEFAAGQRTAVLHASFCPPFDRLPQVEAHTTPPTAATVKIAEVLHHGVRLEVRRRREADAAGCVAIELHATPAEPPVARAATSRCPPPAAPL